MSTTDSHLMRQNAHRGTNKYNAPGYEKRRLHTIIVGYISFYLIQNRYIVDIL